MTVSPGFIETDASTTMIERMAAKANSDSATARQQQMEMLGGIPIGRPSMPKDVRSSSYSSPQIALHVIRKGDL